MICVYSRFYKVSTSYTGLRIKGVGGLKEHELDESGYLAHMSDLKASYRETHRVVRASIEKDNAEESALYKGAEAEHRDTVIKRGIIEDLNMAINWMHTGKMPGSKRGADRRSAYQKHKFVDPLIMQAFSNPVNSRSVSTLTSVQLLQIENALGRLSPNERECFVSIHGNCTPMREVASRMCITLGSVQTFVNRAQKKVSEYLEMSLFIN
jgi:RNA polymerase sigma-70 factor (ECF subfamily)